MAKNTKVAEEKNQIEQNKKEQKKVDKQKKVKKENKDKKPGLFRRLRDAWGELKKVTWPSFATVVKKTGVVLLVVVIFTVVLFGIEFALGNLFNVIFG